MGAVAIAPSSRLKINLFDGARQPFSDDVDVLITVKDGNQRQILRDFFRASTVAVGAPVSGNLADRYTVLAWAKGYRQAGYYPVIVKADAERGVDIMLTPKRSAFNFARATWKALDDSWPQLKDLLREGASEAAASSRYGDLEESGAPLACLLNIATATRQIQLPEKTGFDYLREVVFSKRGDAKPPAADRFFVYADRAIIAQIELAREQGIFEAAPYSLHPGATSSYKQVQFGEANVQFTFHDSDPESDRVLLELDMDYYRDPAAHLILEVAVNAFGSVTDPATVYVLRWIAGRHAGIPEFDPPYTIEKA